MKNKANLLNKKTLMFYPLWIISHSVMLKNQLRIKLMKMMMTMTNTSRVIITITAFLNYKLYRIKISSVLVTRLEEVIQYLAEMKYKLISNNRFIELTSLIKRDKVSLLMILI